MPTRPTSDSAHLPAVTREVEQFVSTGGWDQPPQLFALVPTADLVAKEPDLADKIDDAAPLTPIAQDALPEDDLAAALGAIMWPEAVRGCALAHEIVVLPPRADPDESGNGGNGEDGENGTGAASERTPVTTADALRQMATEHPQRREARLVAAVLRDGSVACVLRLRGDGPDDDQILEHPDLAPNLTDALLDTLRP